MNNNYQLIFLITFPIFGICVRKIPDNILMGVATSSYQIEGAWNISDKGESIWDHYTHTGNITDDGSNGDIACDSYHRYERDVEMLKELGVDHYRFSISWTRILPNGFINKTSPSGIEYYNKLIDKMKENNIEPVVTIYHWDLPIVLSNLGGWTNPDIIKYFTDFSDLLFKLYGDRVKYWITINEPTILCMMGQGKTITKTLGDTAGPTEYICGHNVLKSHAAVYHLYRKKYKPIYNGRVSIALLAIWWETLSDSPDYDKIEAETRFQYAFGWFAHPIFSKKGDYPQILKKPTYHMLKYLGFTNITPPQLSKQEISEIRGSYDYLGLNYYSAAYISKENIFAIVASAQKTQFIARCFRKLLNWIKNDYDNPDVFILENGLPDVKNFNDDNKIYYISSHINAILDSVQDGCKVIGYTIWGLMDCFSWQTGYNYLYGLYHVDFNNPNRTRTPRKSAYFYQEFIRNKIIP